jgi:hypothetical protein
MEGTEDLLARLKALEDENVTNKRNKRFDDFMGTHGSKFKNHKGLGDKMFEELEHRGVDITDEAVEDILSQLREDIADLSDAVAEVKEQIAEGQQGGEASLPPPPSPPSGESGAPPTDGEGASSPDMPPPPPDMGGDMPPPPDMGGDMPPPDMGGDMPPPDMGTISDKNLKETDAEKADDGTVNEQEAEKIKKLISGEDEAESELVKALKTMDSGGGLGETLGGLAGGIIGKGKLGHAIGATLGKGVDSIGKTISDEEVKEGISPAEGGSVIDKLLALASNGGLEGITEEDILSLREGDGGGDVVVEEVETPFSLGDDIDENEIIANALSRKY